MLRREVLCYYPERGSLRVSDDRRTSLSPVDGQCYGKVEDYDEVGADAASPH